MSTLPLNLPALLAFFTTAATVSLAIPLSECISQWKWNYLRADARSLSDFQLFDSASRSPPGAVSLLLKLRHTHIASAGALVLLVSLTAPAVTQVAIGYSEGTVLTGGGGAIASAIRVLDGKIEGLATAVKDGVAGEVELSLPIECHTGQCDFDSFVALGICSEVHEISDKLTVTDKGSRNKTASLSSYNVSLPEAANCHFVTGQPLNVMVCKTEGSATLSFDGELEDTAIAAVPIIYSNPEDGSDDADVDFEALEILFHLCLNTYSASVRGAQSHFKITETSTSLASGSGDRKVDVKCDMPTRAGSKDAVECDAKGGVPSDASIKLEDKNGDDNTEASAHFGALEEIAAAIGEGLVGLWMREGDDEPSVTGTSNMEDISKLVYDGKVGEQKDRVTKMAESIATSLTNA